MTVELQRFESCKLTRNFFFLSGVKNPFFPLAALASSSSLLLTSAFFRSLSSRLYLSSCKRGRHVEKSIIITAKSSSRKADNQKHDTENTFLENIEYHYPESLENTLQSNKTEASR